MTDGGRKKLLETLCLFFDFTEAKPKKEGKRMNAWRKVTSLQQEQTHLQQHLFAQHGKVRLETIAAQVTGGRAGIASSSGVVRPRALPPVAEVVMEID